MNSMYYDNNYSNYNYNPNYNHNYDYSNYYEQVNPYYEYNARAMATPIPTSAPAPESAQEPSGNIYLYPENVPNALMQIQNAVNGENTDRMFYAWLMNNAPSQEDKDIISGIRDDELGHYNTFQQLYYNITGQRLAPPEENNFLPPANYCQGLSQAIKNEQAAVQNYREILYAMENRVEMNIIIQIITDEIRHGILYNYLYSKNDCSE